MIPRISNFAQQNQASLFPITLSIKTKLSPRYSSAKMLNFIVLSKIVKCLLSSFAMIKYKGLAHAKREGYSMDVSKAFVTLISVNGLRKLTTMRGFKCTLIAQIAMKSTKLLNGEIIREKFFLLFF